MFIVGLHLRCGSLVFYLVTTTLSLFTLPSSLPSLSAASTGIEPYTIRYCTLHFSFFVLVSFSSIMTVLFWLITVVSPVSLDRQSSCQSQSDDIISNNLRSKWVENGEFNRANSSEDDAIRKSLSF